MGDYSINTKGLKMQNDDVTKMLSDIVANLEQATRVQTNLTATAVRQSTLIAKLNERVIYLENRAATGAD